MPIFTRRGFATTVRASSESNELYKRVEKNYTRTELDIINVRVYNLYTWNCRMTAAVVYGKTVKQTR